MRRWTSSSLKIIPCSENGSNGRVSRPHVCICTRRNLSYCTTDLYDAVIINALKGHRSRDHAHAAG